MFANRVRAIWQSVAAIAAAAISVCYWALNTGPHMDTAFEWIRLHQAHGLSDYLRLVALDNQPPLFMTLQWAVFSWNKDSIFVHRLVLGLISLATALGIFWWGTLRQRGAGTRQARVKSLGKFALVLGVAPSILPTLVISRYSTLSSLLWFASGMLLLRVLREDRELIKLALGVTVGLSVATTFSSIALILFIALPLVLWRRRALKSVALGALPGLIAVLAWTIWSGTELLGRALQRSGTSWRDRLAATYENFVWPVTGPASLPTPTTLITILVGCGSLVVLLWKLGERDKRERAVLILNWSVSAIVFGTAGLANGNMAGPSLFMIALVFSNLQMKEKSRIYLTLLVISMLISFGFTLSNRNVLRPFMWANAAPTAVELAIRKNGANPCPIIDGGDQVTEALFRNITAHVQTSLPRNMAAIPECAKAVVLRGDEYDRSAEWAHFQEIMSRTGFQGIRSNIVAPYTQSDSRARLGMYNVAGSQYEIWVFEKQSSTK